MAKFILAYHPDAHADPSGGDRDAWRRWLDGLGAAVIDPGTPLGKSRLVTKDGVADDGGAFPLQGFTIVQAETVDDAIAMAKACPFLEIGTIEVAPIMPMPG